MKKYKYCVLDCKQDNLSLYLNDLGNDGFELVQILAFSIPKMNGGKFEISISGAPVIETNFKLICKKEIQ